MEPIENDIPETNAPKPEIPKTEVDTGEDHKEKDPGAPPPHYPNH